MAYPEDRENTNESRKALIEFPVPWGLTPVRIRGHDLIAIVVSFYICATLFLFYRGFVYAQEQDLAREKEHQAIITSNQEMSFLIHLGAEERAALKLPMPESLRKRVGPDEYYNFLQERYKRNLEMEKEAAIYEKNQKWAPDKREDVRRYK